MAFRKKGILSILGLMVVALTAAVLFLPVSPFGQYPWSESIHEIEPGDIIIDTVATDLTAPWSLDFIDADRLVFAERPGTVRLIENGRLFDQPLLELPGAPSEGGTLGLAVDPNFVTSRYIYLYYTTNTDNRIVRYRMVNNKLVDEEIILSGIPAANIHNGGRIAFGPDGHLYAGTGDAGESELAQDRNSLGGKILRLRHDGTVPIDNPFPDSYVYSLGHRNVQGLAWDSKGNLYATEHGSQAHDEINKIEASTNYGWPVVEGMVELGPTADAPVGNYNNPVIESGSTTWAPSGAAFYTGDLLPEEWRGKFIFSGLRSQSLWRLDPDTERLERLFKNKYGRLRDVRQGPDGALYILTSNRDGRGAPEDNDDRILRVKVQ